MFAINIIVILIATAIMTVNINLILRLLKEKKHRDAAGKQHYQLTQEFTKELERMTMKGHQLMYTVQKTYDATSFKEPEIDIKLSNKIINIRDTRRLTIK